jgi:hypothetical protein
MMMSVDVLRMTLFWSALLNYGVLLCWFVVFVRAHDWMQRMHGRWFHLSREQFDAVHYAGMAIYKVGILLFHLIPALALSLMA